MNLFHYASLCLFIGTYLYFHWIEAPLPPDFHTLNLWVNGALLVWAAYQAVRIIVDCLRLYSKKQMSAENMKNGIVLSLLHFLPALLMSVFLLSEGFVDK